VRARQCVCAVAVGLVALALSISSLSIAWAQQPPAPAASTTTPTEPPKAEPKDTAGETGDGKPAETKDDVGKDGDAALTDAQKLQKTEEELKKAKEDAANAKAAAQAKRLIRYGVSAGVAASVQFPFWGDNTLEEPAAAAMPYLVLLPAYWRSNPARNAYCAARWSGPEENAIQAANAEALDTDNRSYLQIKRELREMYDKQSALAKTVRDAQSALETREKEALQSCLKSPPPAVAESSNEEKERACRDVVVNNSEVKKARDDLNVLTDDLAKLTSDIQDAEYERIDRSCAGHMVGVYVGYPASFGATTEVYRGTATDVARREVSPVISVGLAFVPNAIVTVLAGPTLGTVKRDDGTSAVVWSLSAGLGVNVDLVNALP
jgi:hypothetical protein